MKPVNEHLALKQDRNAFRHLIATVEQPRYTLAFSVTTLLATGGFMLMPFGSAYTVHNLGIDIVHLPTIYLVSGLFSIFTGPLVGRASDAFGKFPTFAFGSAVSVVMVLIYTHLGSGLLTTAIVVNVLMFVGIFSRMIPSQALISAIPEPSQRGSFSAVSSSAAAALRRARLGSRRRDHRAKCRRFAPAFRLARIHRGRDHAGLAGGDVFRPEVGRGAGGSRRSEAVA